MTPTPLTMGVIGTAHKANERRAPIAPEHFERISPELRERIFVESGYGERFGVADDVLARHVAGMRSREALFAECDIVLLPKPTEPDFGDFRPGQIIWGWPHCVQGRAITQVGIDKRLTYIAWEAMNLWRNGVWDMHVFARNNELAGYASLVHAVSLAGFTGLYGPRKRVAVIGFGSTGRGAVHALEGLGFHDITVFIPHDDRRVPHSRPGIDYRAFDHQTDMASELANYDIIMNCILQDPERPFVYVDEARIGDLRDGTLIIDVSCDAGMGFSFARPTGFDAPMFTVDGRIMYYAVDHSPSYLWRSATWEISSALLPYIPVVMAGAAAWAENETIQRAIEIRDGEILNPQILSFQKRSPDYPHAPLAGS